MLLIVQFPYLTRDIYGNIPVDTTNFLLTGESLFRCATIDTVLPMSNLGVLLLPGPITYPPI